ncbi:unnamed protein product [Prorocentrum cordatum]|uniref:Uncharacterized protein n=1 Tax=Prorocentrum cordatum TaxID=2364126 RepID=A0ABN9SHC1_9DINO|nr:unnamed protein product [Polarella glacialis]
MFGGQHRAPEHDGLPRAGDHRAAAAAQGRRGPSLVAQRLQAPRHRDGYGCPFTKPEPPPAAPTAANAEAERPARRSWLNSDCEEPSITSAEISKLSAARLRLARAPPPACTPAVPAASTGMMNRSLRLSTSSRDPGDTASMSSSGAAIRPGASASLNRLATAASAASRTHQHAAEGPARVRPRTPRRDPSHAIPQTASGGTQQLMTDWLEQWGYARW